MKTQRQKVTKAISKPAYCPKLYFSIKHMKRIQLSVLTDRLLQGTPSFAIEEKCPQRMILLTTAEQAVWEHGLQKQNCREIHNTAHPQETPISTQNQGRVKQAVSYNAAKLQFPFCRQTWNGLWKHLVRWQVAMKLSLGNRTKGEQYPRKGGF